ncbi:MAG: hypothetical protein K6F84_03385 [Lachnospiraceae bacterium]|nr:hypothetical protein [Lachnospiraceae bacterium]
MNRFNPKNRSKLPIMPILSAAAFVVLFSLFVKGVANVEKTTYEKEDEQLKAAVQRGITECYSLEGAYPKDIDYLCDHYGLTYNKDSFLVDYYYFGGNISPEYEVIRKSK